MGRNKIRIEKIQDKRVKHVTFNKRKKGIMKKARELSVLCNSEIMLCITDESKKICYIYHSTNDHLSFITNLIHNKQIKIEREFPSIQENSDEEPSINVETDNNFYNKRKIVSLISNSEEVRLNDNQTEFNSINNMKNLKDSPPKCNITTSKNGIFKRAKVFKTNLNYNDKYLRSYLFNSNFNLETNSNFLNLKESDTKMLILQNSYKPTTNDYNNFLKNTLESKSSLQSFNPTNNTYSKLVNKFKCINEISENDINRDINN